MKDRAIALALSLLLLILAGPGCRSHSHSCPCGFDYDPTTGGCVVHLGPVDCGGGGGGGGHGNTGSGGHSGGSVVYTHDGGGPNHRCPESVDSCTFDPGSQTLRIHYASDGEVTFPPGTPGQKVHVLISQSQCANIQGDVIPPDANASTIGIPLQGPHAAGLTVNTPTPQNCGLNVTFFQAAPEPDPNCGCKGHS